jgi:hypothetical protein
MDTLTHGLLGLTVGAIRQPEGTPTDRAVLLAAVIAAELPDLDYLWPSDKLVLVTLRAHRGLSHALVEEAPEDLARLGVREAVQGIGRPKLFRCVKNFYPQRVVDIRCQPRSTNPAEKLGRAR